MKKILSLVAFLFCLNAQSQSPSLSLLNITGSNSITCSTPSVIMAVSVTNYPGAISYTWFGPGTPTSATSVALTVPGSYTVMASDPSGSLSLSQTFTLGINITPPSLAVTPSVQSITCLSNTATVSRVVVAYTGITERVYSPYCAIPLQSVPFYSLTTAMVNAPGVYTNCATSSINGCSTCQQFTVTSPDNFPLINVTSSLTSLGCGSASITTVALSGSTIPGGAIMSYTLLSFLSPSNYSTSFTSTYAVSAGGGYIAVVKDANTGCETKVPFSLLYNNISPAISAVAATYTLTCYNPTVQAFAVSSSTNVFVQWAYGGLTYNGTVLTVNSGTNLNTTLAGNYTLTATDASNLCTNATVIQFYQDLFPPHAVISGGSNNAITCNTPSIVLSNQSTSGIPTNSGFQNNLPVVAQLWEGPVPQPSAGVITSYMAATPGVYTLTVKDLNNGCFASGNTTVSDQRIYPIAGPSAVFDINCPDATAMIHPNLISQAANTTYTWIAPASAVVTGANTGTLTVNQAGTYTVFIANASGCTISTTVNVEVCVAIKTTAKNNSLKIFPNPGNGVFIISNIATNSVVEIYNTLGGLVHRQTVTTAELSFDLSDEPNGIYFISMTDEAKLMRTAKIIKQ